MIEAKCIILNRVNINICITKVEQYINNKNNPAKQSQNTIALAIRKIVKALEDATGSIFVKFTIIHLATYMEMKVAIAPITGNIISNSLLLFFHIDNVSIAKPITKINIDSQLAYINQVVVLAKIDKELRMGISD